MNRETIIKKLTVFNQEHGIAFVSEAEAVDYYRGLVELIESLSQKERLIKEVEEVRKANKLLEVSADSTTLMWKQRMSRKTDDVCDEFLRRLQSV